jgi:hypothetical protein
VRSNSVLASLKRCVDLVRLAELSDSALSQQREVGSVKTRHYMAYLRANGYIGVAFYVLSIVLNQAFQIFSALWLKNWSQHNNEQATNTDTGYYLSVYFALGLGKGVLILQGPADPCL